MNKNAKIYVAGHRGMVGSAIVRRLEKGGFSNILKADSRELDLRRQTEVEEFFRKNRPDFVFLAAAKVGGILANNLYRAEFLYDNLLIEANIIQSAHLFSVKKLLFLGSSCIYPKFAEQPLVEESLLTGPLEPTNEPYAVAKIAGIKLCDAFRDQYGCDFISAMPTNLYGPNDNYHPENSHVLPALLRKIHVAKQKKADSVVIWGTGSPLREFLHADDLADACLFLMENFSEKGPINVGTGEDLSILELTKMVAEIVGFEGKIEHDLSKPDGTPRKLMDVSRLHGLGWRHKIGLREGITAVYESVKNQF